MRIIFFSLYLLAGAAFAGFVIGNVPEPAPNKAGYATCVQLHPERYCAITYLGRN